MNKNYLSTQRACPSPKVLTAQASILSQTLVGPPGKDRSTLGLGERLPIPLLPRRAKVTGRSSVAQDLGVIKLFLPKTLVFFVKLLIKRSLCFLAVAQREGGKEPTIV